MTDIQKVITDLAAVKRMSAIHQGACISLASACDALADRNYITAFEQLHEATRLVNQLALAKQSGIA